MTTNGRKRVNMIWANEAGVSVYIYEAEHERRTIEIHGVVNDYETVLATATIEKHNRDRLAEAVGNDLQSQLEQLRAENVSLRGRVLELETEIDTKRGYL